ncbi:VWA domain-containing protein [Aestuariicella hydrocarbonica]|uniref:VWA domain-containing protein n=1 Tax=Pseudomaricurvus hydrocarbonicus TaxID=1470433 RepID=A0A9E5ML83_9GAMM|nr:VWA domain-containing protein [Aestuariicella hydrocarbonica]NHO64043.1 VWA domain-containing protein [Aestuariicella hydrocarbonica]
MAKKRRFTTFSLSFLDIMSCGFGAVALIFLIIKHDVDNRIKVENQDLLSEVSLLQEDIQDGEEGMVRARNTLSALDQRLADADGLATRISQDIEASRSRLEELISDQDDDSIESLEQKVRQLQSQKDELERVQQDKGNDVRQFIGQGNRQYLTGMKFGGSHILILLDASASMLDESIVNIIRRRNMPDGIKRNAEKWQRSMATVDWLSSQFPGESLYQIYTFNTDVTSVLKGSENSWLKVSDGAQLEQGILNLRKTVPEGGTSLERVFQAVSLLNPRPDNIYLITDGLPTQGLSKPRKNTISGPERVKLFNKAVGLLPDGIPVNVILAPMEGDPMAAAAFWQLAQITQGSFISPSKDWP